MNKFYLEKYLIEANGFIPHLKKSIIAISTMIPSVFIDLVDRYDSYNAMASHFRHHLEYNIIYPIRLRPPWILVKILHCKL